MFELESLYTSGKRPVVTAHRGFSGKFPENTIPAFEAAYKIGADIVEFDVRETSDGKLIIMHDTSVDRTTNGSGEVSELEFDYIRTLNASYWTGTHDTGKRLEDPTHDFLQVPTFREVLEFLDNKEVGINIQVYINSEKALKEICDLYVEFNLFKRAFLMISTFAQAEEVKAINSSIEVCVGEERDNLKRHKDFGSKIIQPWRDFVTPEFCEEISKLGFWANMFYSNTQEENEKYLSYGIQGILTDRPDLLVKNNKN